MLSIARNAGSRGRCELAFSISPSLKTPRTVCPDPTQVSEITFGTRCRVFSMCRKIIAPPSSQIAHQTLDCCAFTSIVFNGCQGHAGGRFCLDRICLPELRGPPAPKRSFYYSSSFGGGPINLTSWGPRSASVGALSVASTRARREAIARKRR